jgi:hypothetical protein
MVLNTTFNNIQLYRVLMMEETGENHDLSQVTDKLYHITLYQVTDKLYHWRGVLDTTLCDKVCQ